MCVRMCSLTAEEAQAVLDAPDSRRARDSLHRVP